MDLFHRHEHEHEEEKDMTDTHEVGVEVHPAVGLPDGHVDHNNEKIVYERDAKGNVVAWHKEAVKNG